MEWSREMRYRQMENVSKEEWKQLNDQVSSCPWRQTYHVQPPTGLLNDPNGFAYYNGEYHLFYQWFPLGPIHGLKHWYHTSSIDLVNWKDRGTAIFPDTDLDSHGAYSGSGIVHEDKLYLFYTGNSRDASWNRHSYQCLAVMDKNGSIMKQEQAVIPGPPDGYTEHFRDPKVWEENGSYFMVIGAQRKNKTGAALLYTSTDMLDWKFRNEINTSYNTFGYMWECPDYFELQNNGILIFSPQGIEAEGDNFRNIYQSGYLLGHKLNKETGEFSHEEFAELDFGFDFYAPQTSVTPDGRRILVGWMGLPDLSYPTDKHMWAHCLTLPRELTIHNNKLLQKPAEELRLLRQSKKTTSLLLDNQMLPLYTWEDSAYELDVRIEGIEAGMAGISFCAGETEKTMFYYDADRQKLVLDRSLSGEPASPEFGTTRSVPYDEKNVNIRMFVDTSSVEIFINKGEAVFTSRLFPSPDSKGIQLFSHIGEAAFYITKWSLKSINKE
ncbi:sucrose-6-phosphate hydrolase [Alteribacillus sp. HJP-4]|uniref:sucrose-6-phosphate hydrolase n=1 Tax=Alteribacillus sp. HJP-4 TaxID=2775394 RepID=UPI0035CCE2C9